MKVTLSEAACYATDWFSTWQTGTGQILYNTDGKKAFCITGGVATALEDQTVRGIRGGMTAFVSILFGFLNV